MSFSIADRWSHMVLLGVACGMLLGCGGNAPGPEPKPEATSEAEPNKQGQPQDKQEEKVEYVLPDIAGLPEVGAGLPPLDDGRIVISGPEKWVRAPRNDAVYLAMWRGSMKSRYPRLLVRVAEADEIKQLKPEYADEFTQNLAKELEKDVISTAIGDRTWCYYEYKARAASGTPLDVAVLLTVFDGRQYEVELSCVRGTLNEFKPLAFAVAKSIELKPAEAESPAP